MAKKNGKKDDTLMPAYGTEEWKELHYIATYRTMGLSLDDILSKLEMDHDIKISRRTLCRRIEQLQEQNLVRLRNMPEEYKHEYLKRIDTLHALETKLWEIVNHDGVNSDNELEVDVSDKLRAMQQLQALQTDIQNFYNAGPIVHGMMRALESEK